MLVFLHCLIKISIFLSYFLPSIFIFLLCFLFVSKASLFFISHYFSLLNFTSIFLFPFHSLFLFSFPFSPHPPHSISLLHFLTILFFLFLDSLFSFPFRPFQVSTYSFLITSPFFQPSIHFISLSIIISVII